MRRKLTAGFTLIELMVVILILGVLISVLFFGVLPAIERNRANLDANELSTFKQKLDYELGAKGGSKFRAVNGGTSADKNMPAYKFLHELVKRKAFDSEAADKLAGGSGSKPGENGWKSEVNPQDHVVFTCPNTGDEFVARAQSDTPSMGVLFCYNEFYYKKKSKLGIVTLVCGAKTAKLVEHAIFQDEFLHEANAKGWEGKEAKPLDPEDTSFYGKWPFQGMPKE